MKIGINGRFLTKPYTGIGQYTKNLLKEMAALREDVDFLVVLPAAVDENVKRAFGKNVTIKVLPEKRGTAGMKKTWWEQIIVPEFFLKAGVDVAFFPYPSNPWTKDWYRKGIKTIVTIHDCIPWVMKEYRRGILSKMYHWQTRRAVALADKVVAVSETSKNEVVKVCGIDSRDILVAHNDADEVYKERDIDKEVLGRFGLKNRGYFLYVGGYDKRKNVRYLVEEYEKFARDFDGEMPLVLAGGKVLKGRLYKSFDEAFGGNVIRTGFLDERSLASLYAGCRAFVNFSEKEGFNIPIVEAANMGAPIILSDIDVHREIAGGFAMMVDIKKSGAGTKAMTEIMKSEVGANYIDQSKRLAKKFSWAESAKKVLRTFFMDLKSMEGAFPGIDTEILREKDRL